MPCKRNKFILRFSPKGWKSPAFPIYHESSQNDRIKDFYETRELYLRILIEQADDVYQQYERLGVSKNY